MIDMCLGLYVMFDLCVWASLIAADSRIKQMKMGEMKPV